MYFTSLSLHIGQFVFEGVNVIQVLDGVVYACGSLVGVKIGVDVPASARAMSECKPVPPFQRQR